MRGLRKRLLAQGPRDGEHPSCQPRSRAWLRGTSLLPSLPGGVACAAPWPCCPLQQAQSPGQAVPTTPVCAAPRAVPPLVLCRPSPCCPFTAQLQELLEPGAHAQDAHAGGEGRAEPRPPAAGVPAQGEAAAPSHQHSGRAEAATCCPWGPGSWCLGPIPPDPLLLPQVRFSPNLDSQGWLLSGGQAGIVRAHCVAGLASGTDQQLLPQCRARFSSLYGAEPCSPGPPAASPLPAE